MFTFYYSLEQGWPTQIGVGAAFEKIAKSFDFCQKLRKNVQNIGKSQSFDPGLGRRNLLLGRMRPEGHPCLRIHERRKIINLIDPTHNFPVHNLNKCS
jgi:hypothetical protein